MWLRIVGSVRLDPLRVLAWWSGFSTYRWNVVYQRQEFIHIMHVGRGQDQYQRHAPSIGEQVMLAAGFTPIRGIWARFGATAHSAEHGAIHNRPRPIDFVSPVQLGQQPFVQMLPHTVGLPITQSTPTGHSAAAAHLLWQVFPRNSCPQNK